MKSTTEYCKNIANELTAIYNGEYGEDYNLWDWIPDNVLDFEYIANSRKEYRSVRLWVTLGGPNVWIDTANATVNLAWGQERVEYPLPCGVRDALDDIYSEFWSE